MRTVGVVNRIEDKKVIEIAEPFGVVAAIVPSTNPTSTAIYKILIALKARCPIVISPHPVGGAVHHARRRRSWPRRPRAPARPPGSIGWMKTVTLEGTQELMKQRDVAVILATGGMGLVRAAYSAGKPAYGVGPGQRARATSSAAPTWPKAARDIVLGKTFDNGVLCSSPNSVVVDAAGRRGGAPAVPGAGRVLPERRRRCDKLAAALVTPQRLPNPALVGKTATAHRREGRHRGARRHPRASSRRSRAWAATIRCRSRSCARCCPGTW